MSAVKGTEQMATEAGQQQTADGVEIVLDATDGDVEIVLDRRTETSGVVVDYIAVVDEAVQAALRPTVEVTVVDDAYITADHADARQVFASAARLRPLFAAFSLVLMVAVAFAVYGVSVLLAA